MNISEDKAEVIELSDVVDLPSLIDKLIEAVRNHEDSVIRGIGSELADDELALAKAKAELVLGIAEAMKSVAGACMTK